LIERRERDQNQGLAATTVILLQGLFHTFCVIRHDEIQVISLWKFQAAKTMLIFCYLTYCPFCEMVFVEV
jgi:hypothetical protein